MDLLDKGKHCSEEFCHQLDYLPMKCNACLKYFCSDHFKYESHNCKKAENFDYQIPTCDLCHETIEFKRGKDLDLCLAQHLQKCQFSSRNQETKKSTKKCHYKNCKSKEVFVFKCDECFFTYCTKHRLPEDHICDTVKNQARSSQFRNISSKTQSKNLVYLVDKLRI